MRCIERCTMNAPIFAFGTVWMLSGFTAQFLNRPLAWLSTTSVGIERMMLVMGAIVRDVRNGIKELCVRRRMG